jgi:hypothetical protein
LKQEYSKTTLVIRFEFSKGTQKEAHGAKPSGDLELIFLSV